MIRRWMLGLTLAALATPGFAAAPEKGKNTVKGAKTGTEAEACECCKDECSAQRVFEMRTYVTHENRLDALNARFRNHTNTLFKKHGIQIVGYWTPQDEKDGKKDKLVYLLAYPSREAAEASWKAFRADPEWQKVAKESEKDGKIVKEVVSVFLNPTDYSPIK